MTIRKYGREDIRRIRKTTRLDKTEFADLILVNKSTLVAWERGTKVPSERWMKILNIIDRHGVVPLTHPHRYPHIYRVG
jgi:DNA-binding transcriptional regulator YiaG